MKYPHYATTLLCSALYSSAYASTPDYSTVNIKTGQIAVYDADRWVNPNDLLEASNASLDVYQQLVFAGNCNQSTNLIE